MTFQTKKELGEMSLESSFSRFALMHVVGVRKPCRPDTEERRE
jgi:hypothetical protein